MTSQRGIITIENLLMMRSGLVDYTSDFWLQWTFFWYPWAGYSRRQPSTTPRATTRSTCRIPTTTSSTSTSSCWVRCWKPSMPLHGTSRTVREILEDDILTPLGLTKPWPDNSNLPHPGSERQRVQPRVLGLRWRAGRHHR